MNKPDYSVYERFARRFADITQKAGKKQYLLPYYISSHPGSTLLDAIELAVSLKAKVLCPSRYKIFTPPRAHFPPVCFTLGINPLTNSTVYVARDPKEKSHAACAAFVSKQSEPRPDPRRR